MHKKKILHITSSLKIGGAESLLYDLILGLGSEDYEHHVIYFHSGPHVERLQEHGIATYHVCGLVSLYDPVFFFRLWRLVKTIKPDVIHTALWAANFAGRVIGYLQGIPTICAVHLGVDLDGAIRNRLDALTFGLATHVIAVSEDVAQSVRNRSSWIDTQKMTVIKNGVDADAIASRAHAQEVDRSNLGLTNDQCVIGAVGRFIPRKNFDQLIEAFALVHTRYPYARLVLVGLGEQESYLREKARTLGVEHEVIFIVGKSAYGYYPLFDIFAQPSAQEGLSIALLEALCFSIPCVATAHNTHEVIKHGYDGYVVEPHNVRSLYTALDALVADIDKRSFMGEHAGITVRKQFSLKTMVEAYRHIIEKNR